MKEQQQGLKALKIKRKQRDITYHRKRSCGVLNIYNKRKRHLAVCRKWRWPVVVGNYWVFDNLNEIHLESVEIVNCINIARPGENPTPAKEFNTLTEGYQLYNWTHSNLRRKPVVSMQVVCKCKCELKQYNYNKAKDVKLFTRRLDQLVSKRPVTLDSVQGILFRYGYMGLKSEQISGITGYPLTSISCGTKSDVRHQSISCFPFDIPHRICHVVRKRNWLVLEKKIVRVYLSKINGNHLITDTNNRFQQAHSPDIKMCR